MYGQNRFFTKRSTYVILAVSIFFLYIHKVSSCFCVFFDNTVTMYERKKRMGKEKN